MAVGRDVLRIAVHFDRVAERLLGDPAVERGKMLRTSGPSKRRARLS
jgi:hypothetical protein